VLTHRTRKRIAVEAFIVTSEGDQQLRAMSGNRDGEEATETFEKVFDASVDKALGMSFKKNTVAVLKPDLWAVAKGVRVGDELLSVVNAAGKASGSLAALSAKEFSALLKQPGALVLRFRRPRRSADETAALEAEAEMLRQTRSPLMGLRSAARASVAAGKLQRQVAKSPVREADVPGGATAASGGVASEAVSQGTANLEGTANLDEDPGTLDAEGHSTFESCCEAGMDVGLSLSPVEKSVVSGVKENGWAATRAKVCVGDAILSINGESCENWGGRQFAEAFRKWPRPLKVVFRRVQRSSEELAALQKSAELAKAKGATLAAGLVKGLAEGAKYY